MEDRISEILGHYDFTADTCLRARGAMLVSGQDGYRLLSTYRYKEVRAEFEDFVKNLAKDNGFENIDLFIRNREGSIITKNSWQESYTLRKWFDAEESSIKREESVIAGVETLAGLHRALVNGTYKEVSIADEHRDFMRQTRLDELFQRRFKELKRVRLYVKQRNPKNDFETEYINMCDRYIYEAEEAIGRLEASGYKKMYEHSLETGKLCHGDYNYHNILEIKNSGGKSAVVNFDKAVYGVQCLDFYQYLRKAMEKNDWSVSLGSSMIDTYFKYTDAGEEELELIRILLGFPEKFWKLTNFYYNGRKTWIPQKNVSKLLALKEQQEKKRVFIEKL